MIKGRKATFVAPLLTAALLLGVPAATFAAPKEGQPPPADQGDRRGSRSAQPGEGEGEKEQPKAGDPDAPKDPQPGKDAKAPDKSPEKNPEKSPEQNPGKDGNAGDKPSDKPSDKPGDKAGENKQPEPGEQAAGKGKKDKDGRDRDDDDHGRRYDGPDGRYDHHRHGYHGRHGWDTHRRYYRYGYHGPGYYDDCGYYGPEGYNGWYYNSPDACDWQYGAQGESLRSNLAGDQVIPGPGAPNAFGIANLFVDLGRGVLCYRMGYDGTNRPSGAHVHRGGPGQVGQPVIDLHPEMNGDEGCVGADPTALRNLRDHPEAFYLQLHTPEYPEGALRGQLYPTGHYR